MLRLEFIPYSFNTTIGHTDERWTLWYCTAYAIVIDMLCRPLNSEPDDKVENNGNSTLEVPF